MGEIVGEIATNVIGNVASNAANQYVNKELGAGGGGGGGGGGDAGILGGLLDLLANENVQDTGALAATVLRGITDAKNTGRGRRLPILSGGAIESGVITPFEEGAQRHYYIPLDPWAGRGRDLRRSNPWTNVLEDLFGGGRRAPRVLTTSPKGGGEFNNALWNMFGKRSKGGSGDNFDFDPMVLSFLARATGGVQSSTGGWWEGNPNPRLSEGLADAWAGRSDIDLNPHL